MRRLPRRTVVAVALTTAVVACGPRLVRPTPSIHDGGAPIALLVTDVGDGGIEQADTIHADVTTAAAPGAIAAASASERLRGEPDRRVGSWSGRVFVLAIVAIAGLFLWQYRSALDTRSTSSGGVDPNNAPRSAPGSAPGSRTDASESISTVSDATSGDPTVGDASSLSMPAMDAAALLVDALDASTDAGEEDDDDDDDLDASIELDASADGSTTPASVTSGVRRAAPHPTAKPAHKKRAPRRPGHPRKKRR